MVRMWGSAEGALPEVNALLIVLEMVYSARVELLRMIMLLRVLMVIGRWEGGVECSP